MAQVAVEITEFQPEQGLEKNEYTLIARLYQIGIWLSKHKRSAVTKLVKDEYQVGEEEGERWVRKAEDFMTLGVVDGMVTARQVYNYRLERIFTLCMEHAVKDEIEVTTKPTRVLDDAGAVRVVTAQHTKVRPNRLDTGAIAIALKAAREMATINGGRPVDSRGNTTINAQNVQFNAGELPGANVTDQLSNDQLATLAGYKTIPHVEVLSESTTATEGDAAGSRQIDEDPPGVDQGGTNRNPG